MSAAAEWLASRIDGAPASLSSMMMAALQNVDEATIHDALAEAAADCLKRALQDPTDRARAFDLLAADALLTHACEAAAEAGDETLRQFTDKWNPDRFATLL